MASSIIKPFCRRIRKDVNIPGIASRDYTHVQVPAPDLQEGEEVLGWSIIGHDAALQGTLYWMSGYHLTVYNAWTGGTSGATTFEIYWLVG